MDRVFVLALAGSVALALPCASASQSQRFSGPQASLAADTTAAGLGVLPPPPSGVSTIFGGAIRKVDPVRDQLLLNVYGQRPMKILFDARTKVFRDGVKIPLRDLGPAEHASVQTTLDGTRIFAVSIHILSQTPQGQFRGRVLGYDRATGLLRLDAAPATQPFKVLVTGNSNFVRQGQSSFAAEGSGAGDLQPGTLVDVTFIAGGGADGIASQIVVLAVPGSAFVFTGDITALDMAARELTIVDPRDQMSYRIAFDPRLLAAGQKLVVGQRVRITASYNGLGYMASDVTAF